MMKGVNKPEYYSFLDPGESKVSSLFWVPFKSMIVRSLHARNHCSERIVDARQPRRH